ncbi:hypothetical protein TI04_12790, partial [Achromatium sp. WMS2]
KNPKTTPIAAENAKEIILILRLNRNGILIAVVIPRQVTKANITPNNPPKADRTTASIKNCQ